MRTPFKAATLAAALTLYLITPPGAQTLGPAINNEVAEALRMETEATNLASQGRIADADKLYQRSLAIVAANLPNSPILAASLNNIGSFYVGQKRTAEAIPLLSRAVTIYFAAFGDSNRETATAINNLARAYVAEQSFNEAEPLYLRALAATETLLGTDHYAVAISLDHLAQVKFGQKRYSDAEDYLKRGIAVAEKALGPDAPLLVTLMDHMIAVLKAQGREVEAQAVLERAKQIISKNAKR